MGASTVLENANGLPMSTVSSRAISSRSRSMSSPTRFSLSARSWAESLLHGPSSYALRAAATAASASAAVAWATGTISWPSTGLMSGSVRPSWAGTHLPPMNSFPGLAKGWSLSARLVMAAFRCRMRGRY